MTLVLKLTKIYVCSIVLHYFGSLLAIFYVRQPIRRQITDYPKSTNQI
jgi:hypothetical protein